MGQFFVSWALWEKLTFLLACAIAVTILLGFAKLYYNYRKLRQYTAVTEKEGKEKALQRQMSQRSTRRRSQDIPFGIRAIQSGVEVEGVWISRGNTPEPLSARASSTNLTLPEVSSRDDGFCIDIEKLADIARHEGRDMSDQSSDLIRDRSSQRLDCSTSADRLSSGSSMASYDQSPEISITRPSKSRHPPSTFSRYSSNPYMLKRDPGLTTLEAIESLQRGSEVLPSRAHSSDNDDEYIVSSAESTMDECKLKEVLSAAHLAKRARTHSLDLELMQSHRISQVAETGQLTPRARRPGHSGDWTNTTVNTRQIALGDINAGSTRTVDMKHSSTPNHEYTMFARDGASEATPSAGHRIHRLPAHVRRTSMPDVTPFHAFCQSVPPSPRPGSASSMYDLGSIHSPPTSPLPTSASAPNMRPQSQPTLSTSKPSRPKFEKRKSDILRGAGSGFEILVPGTLKTTEHPLERQRAYPPPLSLKRYDSGAGGNVTSRQRSNSTDSARRKLQKRRRPSEESQRSADLPSGRRSRASIA